MIVKYSDGLKQIRFTKALFYIQWIYDKVQYSLPKIEKLALTQNSRKKLTNV